MFVVLKFGVGDLRRIWLFGNRTDANYCFDQHAEGQEYNIEDLKDECVGTLRMAGDDIYAVQLVEVNL